MTRQRGEGALFQRADGMWVGRVEVGYKDGKRRRRTVYGHTRAQAMKNLREARQAVEMGYHETSTPTVAAWLTTWVTQICPMKPRMSPGTLTFYRGQVNNHLIPILGKVRLDRVTPEDVRRLHHEAFNKGLSSTTVGHLHRAFGVAMNDAMREGLIMRNVVSLVPQPAKSPSGRRALSLLEVQRIFHAIEGDRLASRWYTAFMLGMRQGECLGLRWDDVDLENGLIDVRAQLRRLPYKHGCTRPCGRARAHLCPDRVLDVPPAFEYEVLYGNMCLQRPKSLRSTRLMPVPRPLLLSLRGRAVLYAKERPNYIRDYRLVWTRPDGRPIDAHDDSETWNRILASADVPATAQHSARHTTATLLLNMGVSENIIMSILGHSDVLVTRGYAHVDLTLQRKVMGELGTALFPGLDILDQASDRMNDGPRTTTATPPEDREWR